MSAKTPSAIAAGIRRLEIEPLLALGRIATNTGE
jgi:hypothetical protein